MLGRDCTGSEEASKLSYILSLKNHAYLLAKKVSNSELFKLTEQEDMIFVLTWRKSTWISRVLHRESTSISEVALTWVHQRVKGKEAAWNPPGEDCREQRQNSSRWTLLGTSRELMTMISSSHHEIFFYSRNANLLLIIFNDCLLNHEKVWLYVFQSQ